MRSVSNEKIIREMDAYEIPQLYAALHAGQVGNVTERAKLIEECKKQYLQLTGENLAAIVFAHNLQLH